MDDLVRAGKVPYLGISDTPAWQVARMQGIADLRGWSPLVALQIEYSLVERTVERDLIPVARELGLWSSPSLRLRSSRMPSSNRLKACRCHRLRCAMPRTTFVSLA